MMELGWFSTGNGIGSRKLLRTICEDIRNGELNARIGFVFCNREQGEEPGSDEFMGYANEQGLKVVALSWRRFKQENQQIDGTERRKAYDRAVIKLLEGYTVGFVVFAGYMLIAPLLCAHFKTLNLHPALPDGPTGTWKQVVRELVRRRSSRSGAMVHLGTTTVDGGQPLAKYEYSIDTQCYNGQQGELLESSKLFKELRAKQLRYESPLLAETLKAFASEELDFGERTAPLDLTERVEARL